jgi:DNA-binding MarR family transcriptional regulator
MKTTESEPDPHSRRIEGLDEEDPGFGLWISIINRSAQSYFQHYLQDLGVGPGQQAYLLAISPGETIKQEELVHRLKVDRANVTRALQSLERSGCIRRSGDPNDRRAKAISLSEEGIAVRAQVLEVAKSWIDILKSTVTPKEWSQVQRILEKMALRLTEKTQN